MPSDPEAYARYRAELAGSTIWTQTVGPALLRYFKLTPQELRLAPTARSLLRHAEPGRIHDAAQGESTISISSPAIGHGFQTSIGT